MGRIGCPKKKGVYMILYIVGTNLMNMSKFVNWVCESLAGWEPFVNDEFTISDPQEYEDRFVIIVTIGKENVEDNRTIWDYDKMFMGREEMNKLITFLDNE